MNIFVKQKLNRQPAKVYIFGMKNWLITNKHILLEQHIFLLSSSLKLGPGLQLGGEGGGGRGLAGKFVL